MYWRITQRWCFLIRFLKILLQFREDDVIPPHQQWRRQPGKVQFFVSKQYWQPGGAVLQLSWEQFSCTGFWSRSWSWSCSFIFTCHGLCPTTPPKCNGQNRTEASWYLFNAQSSVWKHENGFLEEFPVGVADGTLRTLFHVSFRFLAADLQPESKLWWTANLWALSSWLSSKMKSSWSQTLRTPTGGWVELQIFLHLQPPPHDPLNAVFRSFKRGYSLIFSWPQQLGHIEGEQSRSGTFPANYVQKLKGWHRLTCEIWEISTKWNLLTGTLCYILDFNSHWRINWEWT